MGAVMTKLEKEDEHQAKWRKICTNKLTPKPEAGVVSFGELHILRGGKGRICACPSLVWPDNYSLVVQPEGLSTYLQGLVCCDILVIWNFNCRNLHDDAKSQKTQGTSYVSVLPHLLRSLIVAKVEPQVINFQDCDFSMVEEELFKDFLYSQLGRLEEVTFEGCEGMPIMDNVYEPQKEDEVKRKISVKSVQSLKFEEDISGPQILPDIQE